jgi:hypothetical protein
MRRDSLLHTQSCTLSIELASFNVHAVFADSHPEVLHCEDSASLTSTLSATAISWALDTEIVVFCLGARVLAALCAAWRRCTLWSTRSTQSAHGVVASGVGGPYPRELIGIGSNVGNELLCRKREEAGEVRRGLGRRWQAGACEVVVGNCVGDLGRTLAPSCPRLTQDEAGARLTMGAYSSILPRNSRSVASFFAGIRASKAWAVSAIPFTAGSGSAAPSMLIVSAWVASGLISSSTVGSSSSFTSMFESAGWVVLSDMFAVRGRVLVRLAYDVRCDSEVVEMVRV